LSFPINLLILVLFNKARPHPRDEIKKPREMSIELSAISLSPTLTAPEKPLTGFQKFKAALAGKWPWWFATIGYFLSICVIGLSALFIILYAEFFEQATRHSWVISSFISIGQDFIINEPISSALGALLGFTAGSVVHSVSAAVQNVARNI